MFKFSIIIPVYNVIQYLHECLDSVLCQTFKDYEVIIIDDGSTDGSGAVCDEYCDKDKRIKVYHQKNKGVCAARNCGLKHVSGEYVIFVDSDDYIESFFLETISKHLSDCDLLFWGDFFHFQDGSIHIHKPYSSNSLGRDEIEERILKLKRNVVGYEYFGYIMNKAFCTDIIKQYAILFTEGLDFREDEIFTASYCRYIKNLKVINTPLYHYRILDSGLCAKPKNSEMIERYCNALKKTSTAWHNIALLDWEMYRYVSFLFQAYHCSIKKTEKWRIAHQIRNEYTIRNNSLLKPSKFFLLPLLFFRICLAIKILFKR